MIQSTGARYVKSSIFALRPYLYDILQDREDDVKAGVKSTSLLFGDSVRLILSFFAAAFVLAVAYAGILNSQGPLFFIIGVGGTALHLAWQLITLKPDVPEDCWVKFKVLPVPLVNRHKIYLADVPSHKLRPTEHSALFYGLVFLQTTLM